MNKYEDATLVASNLGPISREERERILIEAEKFKYALLDAYINGTSFADNLEISCEKTEEMIKFSIREKYAVIKLSFPTFNDISREEFQKLSDIAHYKNEN